MCNVKDCKLDEYENGKCILHCEKSDWKKLNDEEKETKKQKFNEEFLNYCHNSEDGEIKEFHFYETFNLLEEFENRKFFFKQCYFYDTFSFCNYHTENCFFLDNCFFYEGVSFSEDIDSEFKFVNSCQFDNKSIDLSGIFSKKLSFIGSDEISEINCNSVVFKEDVVLSSLTIKNYSDFQFTKFSKNCSFFQSRFCSTVDFRETNFIGNVNFLLFHSKDELDLSNTVFEGQSNFLKINVNIKNRETARIIKDSFEQQNNIIEANKFYAIEMQKREEELKPSKNFFEWLVFKTHGLASNHSQDWTLSLGWIILFGMLLTVFKVNLSFDINVVFCLIPFLYAKIEKYMFLLFYGFYFIFMKSLDKSPLDDFATNINPFSIMTSADKLTFTELLFKIIIAFLIYQFIISIRQNTRRK